MAKRGASQQTGNKRQREREKARKREEKANKKLERQELKAQGIEPWDTTTWEVGPEVRPDPLRSGGTDPRLEDSRPSRAPGRGSSQGGTRLFIGNVSMDATEEDLRAAFSEEGRTVKHVSIPVDRDTGRPRGFGFVEMGSHEEAAAAIEALHGAMLDGRPLRVDHAQERPGRGR